nr:PilZ domain-containing protein [Halanaerobacter jeridensis]
MNQLDVEIKNISTRFNLVLLVNPIGEVRKIERRRYNRVQISTAIRYRNLKQQESKTAHLIDVSASGIKMEVESIIDLQVEKKIIIDFTTLDEFPISKIKARILRIKVNQNSRGKVRRYYIGLEFVSVTKEQREEMIEWVQQQKNS